ncbi:MAG: hypothetical protein ACKV2V_27590 [Blastocatellia bacterium]
MKKFFSILLSLSLLSLPVLTPSAQTPQTPAKQPTEAKAEDTREDAAESIITEGTNAKLSLQTQLSSKLNEVGDPVTGVLYEPVRDQNGRVAIARGTEFFGRITQVQPAKRPQKQATMTIVFDTMRMPYGEEKVSVIITAIDDYENDEKLKAKNEEGKVGAGRSGGRSAENAAKGAGLGSLGGLIAMAAGGGLIGLVTVAAGGAGAGVLVTKGNDIRLQPGTVLRIRFERPVKVATFDK